MEVNMNLMDIPDNLLLQILGYLPVKDRCIAGRVCRRWRRIMNDKSLWRHVDLLPYKLDLRKFWKVIYSHLSECLLSIKLRGYMDSKGPNWNTQTVSNAMLDDFRERCPNLVELHLHLVFTQKLQAQKLPRSLTKLQLTRCSWPMGWMNNVELPDLRCLIVDKTTSVENRDINDFVKFTNLEVLSLHGCYRVKEQGIINVAESLTGLTDLDLSDTDCTDLCLHHIARNLKRLSKLSVTACVKVTTSGVICIAEGLNNLRHLDISNCGAVHDECLKALFKVKTLRKLNHTLNTANLIEEDLERLHKLNS